MEEFDYFKELTKSIKAVSSKSDLILFDGVMRKKDRDEILEDCIIISTFYMSVFKQDPPFLMDFIRSDNSKKKLTADERKALGAYFTPPFIAEYIVRQTIGPLIETRKTVEDICDIKICDPALGGAIFLICAHDFLMEEILKISQNKFSPEQLSKMSLKCLFGVDINPKAIEFSKFILNVNMAKWSLMKEISEYSKTVD